MYHWALVALNAVGGSEVVSILRATTVPMFLAH